MKGHSHAMSGAAAWLAVTSPSVAALGVYQQDAPVAIAGSVLCAGAALSCDVDHHSGTIAYSLPPLTKALTAGVEKASGGHRHATHSLVGIAGFTGLTWLATLLIVTIHDREVALGAGLVAMMLVAFAAKALKLTDDLFTGDMRQFMRSPVGTWLLALVVAGSVTWFMDYQWTWLIPCVAIGAFLHCVGDSLTVEGVPWLWPLNPKPPKLLRPAVKWIWHSNGYFAFPILGHTESKREAWFSALLGLYCAYQIVFLLANAAGVQIPYLR